jgi:putative holliday junction resolvase
VDWGERRIGIALSDELQLLAQPLTTLTRRPGKRVPLQQILSLIAEHGVVGVLVGLPLTADGSEGEAGRAARRLGEQLAKRSGLPVNYVDERFTTARALRTIRELGETTRDRKEDLDAMAAAVLLQQYLDVQRG